MSDDYRATIRRLWEAGLVSEDALWRATTPEQRDDYVINAVDSGHLTTDSDEYRQYYNNRMSGRWDINQFSPETRARFGWNSQDDIPGSNQDGQ